MAYRLPTPSALIASMLTAQMVSANVRSVRRKYASPDNRMTTVTVADATSKLLEPPEVPSRARRNPSTTPAIGLSPYQARQGSGTRVAGYAIGVARNQT